MEKAEISDDMEIINVLKSMQNQKLKVWTWQKKTLESGRRPVHFALITRVDPIKNVISLRPTNTGGYRFLPSEPVFFLHEETGIAFLDKPHSLSEVLLTFKIPKLLKRIDPEHLASLQLVEKENEEAHLSKRENPRVNAKEGQIVSVRRYSAKKNIRHPLLKFELYDISPGGLAFIVDDPAEFEVNEELEIIAVQNKAFAKLTVGVVRGVREMEVEEGRGYKVGLQFIAK